MNLVWVHVVHVVQVMIKHKLFYSENSVLQVQMHVQFCITRICAIRNRSTGIEFFTALNLSHFYNLFPSEKEPTNPPPPCKPNPPVIVPKC